jgi:hypothetical protein
MARTIETSWIHEGEGYVVTAEVTGRFTRATRDDPAEGPDVDIILVAEEGGLVRNDLLALAADDPGLIDDILIDAQEDDEGRWEDAQEQRAEAARDARMFGD